MNICDTLKICVNLNWHENKWALLLQSVIKDNAQGAYAALAVYERAE